MKSENISRTAAIIYSEEGSAIKSATVQRKIVESLFVKNDNKELTTDQIIDELKDSLGLDFTKKEIDNLTNDDKKSNFEVRLDKLSKENFFRLNNKRCTLLKKREKENSIFRHIENFKSNFYKGNLTVTKLDKILHKYLYELLNKNIQAFGKIADSSNVTNDLYIDPNIFTLEERTAINQFIDWDDEDKNKAIFVLISYSIEYAVISNNYETSEIFLKSIKDKVFYLDNNVIYRAIGINGQNNKNRITTFLKKCISTGQSFKISVFTEKEFKETIKYNIRNLQRIPFRKINHHLFFKYSLNPDIYEYYHKWRRDRKEAYGFDLFTAHLLGKFDLLREKYNIEVVYKIPFDSKEKKSEKRVLEYQNQIANAKENQGYERSHHLDAQNIYLIEKLRGQNDRSIMDTKYFFVSVDQKLRNWDFSRNESQPIALLPSQWMAILLKYHSRSSNDYKSYLSFLKLKTNKPVIKEDDLQIVLAGISEVTEDFSKQEAILGQMVQLKFEGILNEQDNANEIYKKTIDFASKRYDKELQDLNKSRENEQENFSLEKIQFKENLLREKEESINDFSKREKEIERQVDKGLNRHKSIFILVVVIYFVALGIFIYSIGWDIMNPITYYLTIGFLLFDYLYTVIYGKSLNPKKYFNRKRLKIQSKLFKKYRFNTERYSELKEEMELLKKQIESLKKEHNKTYNK